MFLCYNLWVLPFGWHDCVACYIVHAEILHFFKKKKKKLNRYYLITQLCTWYIMIVNIYESRNTLNIL